MGHGTWERYLKCHVSPRPSQSVRREIWDSVTLVTHIWSTFSLIVLKGIWGVIRCTCLNGGNLKTADRRAKWTEILDSSSELSSIAI